MKNKLIVALDISSFKQAKVLVDKLSPYADIFKVGSELFTSSGPSIIKYIKKKKKKVFLDLKFFDIPNTVKQATLAAAKHGIFMLTLHTNGGHEMLKEAVKALSAKKKRPLLIGITVLTSTKDKKAKEKVITLAKMARKLRLDGIVCSAQETKYIKKICGRKFIVINPGIRPRWAKRNDQKRVATPLEAIQNGADFLVIGRPITQAKNPKKAAKKVVEEIKAI